MRAVPRMVGNCALPTMSRVSNFPCQVFAFFEIVLSTPIIIIIIISSINIVIVIVIIIIIVVVVIIIIIIICLMGLNSTHPHRAVVTSEGLNFTKSRTQKPSANRNAVETLVLTKYEPVGTQRPAQFCRYTWKDRKRD